MAAKTRDLKQQGEVVLIDVHEGGKIWVITMNRPHRMNALGGGMAGALNDAFEAYRDDLEEIEAHIEMEEQAVETYGELAEKSDNEQVKKIALMIREDEFRHHALLKDLHKAVIEPETLTEDLIWDVMWKDSPWKGSPGG